MDAIHFIFCTFLGYLWCFQRCFLPAQAGRKRYNILGAIDAVNKRVITISNETYINARTVCELLKRIYLEYHGKKITVVLDNAKYQRCELVRRYAKLLDIELMFLPSYSPHLNLIERLWKFVKKTCLYSKYYKTFDDFKEAIDVCISETHTVYQEKLQTLLSWKFQSFKKVNNLPF